MNLDDLERLARLREQGVLTDQEFEQQKAKLLSDNPQQEETYEDYEDPPRRRSRIAALKYVLVGIGGLALLYLMGWFDDPPQASSAVKSDTSEWKFEETVDPMTDQQTLTATRQFNAGNYLMNAAIRCTGSTRLDYELALYDRNGNAEAIRTDAKGISYFTMRLDRSQAARYTVVHAQYSNVISTAPPDNSPESFAKAMVRSLSGLENFRSVPQPRAMGTARLITLQVPTDGGEANFQIAQTNSRLRRMLDECHPAQAAPEAASAPEEAVATNVGEVGAASVPSEPEASVQDENVVADSTDNIAE